MKILVTGGAGYIGSTTADELIQAGHEVVILDNLSRGHRAAVPAGARLVVGDIGDREALQALFAEGGFEGLVHFAAYAYVGESTSDPGLYLRNNAAGSFVLFEEAYRAGVRRVVFSSSCTVYGVPQALPLVEDHPQAALSPYGASKMMCEDALRWFASAYDDFGAVALRYFNAAGATEQRGEDHSPETHLIPLAIEAAAGPAGSTDDLRDRLPDARRHLRAGLRPYPRPGRRPREGPSSRPASRASGPTTSARGVGQTVREVLDMVGEVVGSPVPHDLGERREGRRPGVVRRGGADSRGSGLGSPALEPAPDRVGRVALARVASGGLRASIVEEAPIHHYIGPRFTGGRGSPS